MKKNDFTLGKVLLASLLSLFLGASCYVAGAGVPVSLGEALRGAPGGSSGVVGPVGAALAGLAAWGLGPWLRWLLVLIPWIWIPLQTGKAKDRSRRRKRLVWNAAVLLLSMVLLGHPALQRAGFPVRSGGVLGSTLHDAVESLLGGLGAFLVPAGVLAFLLIRALPPIHLELPFLDRLQTGLSHLGGALGGVGRALGAMGSRLRGGLDAWRTRRDCR